MKKTELDNTILKLLNVLDMYIALESNAASTYRRMAHTAKYDGSRALLAWLYSNESKRLFKLTSRRRLILSRHSHLITKEIYQPRRNQGLTKMGIDHSKLAERGPLDILKYAIENETRAMQFFQRKGVAAEDPSMRLLYGGAIKEHQEQIEYLTSQRRGVLLDKVSDDAEKFAREYV